MEIWIHTLQRAVENLQILDLGRLAYVKKIMVVDEDGDKVDAPLDLNDTYETE